MNKLFSLLIIFFFVLFLYPQNAQAFTYYSFDARQYYLDVRKEYFDEGHRCQQYGADKAARISCFERPTQSKNFTQLTRDYDTMVFLSSVQGIVNRYKATFYLITQDVDTQWMTRLKGANIWLNGDEEMKLADVNAVATHFKNAPYGIRGSVVWDDTKPFTLALATTIAGADNLVIVRRNSEIFNTITSHFPVVEDLSTRNFQNKQDAYEWAVNKYLKTGKVNPIPSYIKDGFPVYNMLHQGKMFPILHEWGDDSAEGWYLLWHDKVIAGKTFAFDLAPDANVQPADAEFGSGAQQYAAFENIVRAVREKTEGNTIFQMWGFPNRKYFKCGDYGYNGVQCAENRFTENITKFGGEMRMGEGGFGAEASNGSFYQHGPGTDIVIQNPPLIPQQLIEKGYVTGNPADPYSLQLNSTKKFIMLYQGDYEMANHLIGGLVSGKGWNPSRRAVWDSRVGKLPIAWGITAQGSKDVPPLYRYFASTLSGNDWFVMPDSGMGYQNPQVLPAPYIDSWTREVSNLNRQFGYRSGWILNGHTGNSTLYGGSNPIRNAIKKIAPEGVFFSPFGDGESVIDIIDDGFTVISSTGTDQGDRTAGAMRAGWNTYVVPSGKYQNTQFVTVRFVGADIQDLNDALVDQHPNEVFIDPITFHSLHRVALGGGPLVARSSVISHTLPTFMVKGQTYTATMRIRNDGWETWGNDTGYACDGSVGSGGCYAVAYGMNAGDVTPAGRGASPTFNYDKRVFHNTNVAPGQVVDVTVSITAPSTPGTYTFATDMVKEGQFFFELKGNVPWQKVVQVVEYDADIQRDGVINYEDIEPVISNYGASGRGDINGDGVVNTFDVRVVNSQRKSP